VGALSVKEAAKLGAAIVALIGLLWCVTAIDAARIASSPPQQQNGDDDRATGGQKATRPPITAPGIFAVLTESGLNAEAAYCAEQPNANSEIWLREYRCGVKRTDVFGLWFSGGLILVTVGLLLVGYCQVRVYDRQRQIMDMQNEISARNYIATHRPKIRVKHMWLANDIWSGENIAPRLVITNNGTAPARINRVSFGMTIVSSKRGLQFPPDDEPQNNAPSVPIIGAGVTWEIDAQDLSRPIAALSSEDHVRIRARSHILFCFGQIEYKPAWGNPEDVGWHTTGYCRRLFLRPNASADERGRFRVHYDPDYEYQD
jgi:hypothetical protein